MIESFFVYIGLFLVMLLCGIYATKREPAYVAYSGVYAKNQTFLQPEIILIIITFTFIFGCRWGVGVDYFHYYYYYMTGFLLNERLEPLFLGISRFMYNSGLHFAFFFSFWAFLEVYLFYYALRNYRFLFPLLAFFLIFGFYWMSMMNVIRQQIAACIFLASIQFIEKKKLIPFYISVVIAFLFHKSAVLLVVAYPILRFRTDWFRSVPLQVVIYFACIFLSNRMTDVLPIIEKPFRWFTDTFEYGQYGFNVLNIESLNDKTRFGRNTGLGVYTGIIKCLPVILFSKELKKYYNSNFFNIIYSLWFLVMTLGAIVRDSIILFRPFIYCVNASPIIHAFFCYYCYKTKKPLLQIIAALIMFVQLGLFINFVSYGEFNTSQYTFFWQN